MNKEKETYDDLIAEAKSLGIRYEYQHADHLRNQIAERKLVLKSGGRGITQTYVDPDLRGNVLEDDYSKYNVYHEPFRDIMSMTVGDKCVINPRIAARCANVDLMLLRKVIKENDGILSIVCLDISGNMVTVGDFGKNKIVMPAIAVEKHVTLDKKPGNKSRAYIAKKDNVSAKKKASHGDCNDGEFLEELGLTESQIEVMSNPELTKSDKIRFLYKSGSLTKSAISKAVGVHYSHAYSVMSAYDELLKKNEEYEKSKVSS